MRLYFIFFLLLHSYSTVANERTNEQLPKIKITDKVISSSIGWLKNPEGQWVSRQNRIIANLPESRKEMIDSSQYGMGIDNFKFIQHYNLTLKNKEYDLVIKVVENGRFSSDSVYADWWPSYEYNYFILDKGALNEINLINNKASINKYKAIYAGKFSNETLINDVELPNYIQSEIKKVESDDYYSAYKDSDKYLIINSYYYSKKDIVRFVLFRGCKGGYINVFSTCGGFTRQTSSSDSPAYKKYDYFFSKNMFDTLYFEVPKNKFDKFIPVNISSTKPIKKNNIISQISNKPSSNWVGKTIKVEFDSAGGSSIAHKTKNISIISYSTDSDGYEYFEVKDLSDGYLTELYFFWFDNFNGKKEWGPNIISYQVMDLPTSSSSKQLAQVESDDSNLNYEEIYKDALKAIEHQLSSVDPSSAQYKSLQEVKNVYQNKIKNIKQKQKRK